MRNIKFRGLVAEVYPKIKRWAYGYAIVVQGQHYIVLDDAEFEDNDCINGLVEVIPETVGEFTSRHDKNGREIYEESRLQGVHKETSEVVEGKVVWYDRACRWGIKLSDWTMGFECLFNCFNVEVIHDKPDSVQQVGYELRDTSDE